MSYSTLFCRNIYWCNVLFNYVTTNVELTAAAHHCLFYLFLLTYVIALLIFLFFSWHLNLQLISVNCFN